MDKIMYLLFIVLSACASVTKPEPPALEFRTLRISDEVPGFVYQWETCVKKGLFGKCREWEIKKELYDLRDDAIRNKLKDTGFVGRVREKVKPILLP